MSEEMPVCVCCDKAVPVTERHGLRVCVLQLQSKLTAAQANIKELEEWVNDLQSGLYINCVYCGHRYGPRESTPAVMADVLYEHIKICPKHPLSKAQQTIAEQAKEIERLKLMLKSAESRAEYFREKVGEYLSVRSAL